MGKRLEVYLTNEEVKKMKELCDKHNCSKSRIVKMGISELHVNVDTLKSHRAIEFKEKPEPHLEIKENTLQLEVMKDEHDTKTS